jgi:hypothetical protein
MNIKEMQNKNRENLIGLLNTMTENLPNAFKTLNGEEKTLLLKKFYAYLPLEDTVEIDVEENEQKKIEMLTKKLSELVEKSATKLDANAKK